MMIDRYYNQSTILYCMKKYQKSIVNIFLKHPCTHTTSRIAFDKISSGKNELYAINHNNYISKDVIQGKHKLLIRCMF